MFILAQTVTFLKTMGNMMFPCLFLFFLFHYTIQLYFLNKFSICDQSLW